MGTGTADWVGLLAGRRGAVGVGSGDVGGLRRRTSEGGSCGGGGGVSAWLRPTRREECEAAKDLNGSAATIPGAGPTGDPPWPQRLPPGNGRSGLFRGSSRTMCRAASCSTTRSEPSVRTRSNLLNGNWNSDWMRCSKYRRDICGTSPITPTSRVCPCAFTRRSRCTSGGKTGMGISIPHHARCTRPPAAS